MISQEIKLYDEPVWKASTVITTPKVNYLPYHPYQDIPQVTQAQLDEEIIEAKALGVKIGQRYRYKANKHGTIVLVAWETDPNKATIFGSRIGIVYGKREPGGDAHHYSIDELFGQYMEEVTE